MLPALNKRGELVSLLIAECHDVLLHCVLFAGHESAPSLVTGTSSQRTRAKSMTETTSLRRRWAAEYETKILPWVEEGHTLLITAREAEPLEMMVSEEKKLTEQPN